MTTVISGSSPSITFSDATTQTTAANITAPYTSSGVVYASSTTALTTGSNLAFDGTNLALQTTTASPVNNSSLPGLLSFTGNGWNTSLGSQPIGGRISLLGPYQSPRFGQTTASLSLSTQDSDGSMTQRAQVNAFGIGLGNGTVPSSGTGIAFPATQSASSDANTLDDYEEGTFTPTAYGSSVAGTTTYTLQQGTYTKIGRQVTISVRISYSALTGSGELTFGNFPFTAANDGMEYMGALMTDQLNWGGGSYLQFYKNANTSYGVIFYMADDANWAVQQCVNETAAFRFTITYFV